MRKAFRRFLNGPGFDNDDVVVVRAFASSCDDPRGETIVAQFGSGRFITRQVDGGRYVAAPSMYGAMLPDDQSWETGWAKVHELNSGQLLEFRLEVRSGMASLVGRAVGRWPQDWKVNEDEAKAATAGLLRFPEPASCSSLLEWLGLSDGDGLRCRAPAVSIDPDALPQVYLSFLGISNGAIVGDLVLYAASDVVELSGLEGVITRGILWLIGDVGGVESEMVVLDGSGSVWLADSYDAEWRAAGMFDDWLRIRVGKIQS